MEIIILILLILVLILLVYLMMRPQDKKAWESELNQLRLDLLKDHNESMQRLQNQLRADIREAMQPTGEKLTRCWNRCKSSWICLRRAADKMKRR